jgi:hypothetical protein
VNVGRATLVPTGKEGREGDLSREQLSHDVRDRRFEAFDRSIDVHIASLRKKLGDDLRAARFIARCGVGEEWRAVWGGVSGGGDGAAGWAGATAWRRAEASATP